MPTTVGFIGIGIMDRPMAQNVLNVGYGLVVHNRSRKPVGELVVPGPRLCLRRNRSPSE